MEQLEAEFCGFFWADGNIYAAVEMKPNRKNGKPYPQPAMRLSIGQRADSSELMNWLKEKFGGHVYLRTQRARLGHQSKPILTWNASSIAVIEKVLSILLKSRLPAEKRKQLAVFSEFVSIVRKRRDEHRKYTRQEIEQMRQLGLALKALKRYGEQT